MKSRFYKIKDSIKCLMAILAFCFCNLSSAQISFSDKTHLFSKENHFSGVAMGIIDMNGDGRDDIVRQNYGMELNIELQSQPDQKFVGIEGISTGLNSQWSMCMADIDNNGTNEILTGGTNSEVVIIEMQKGSNSFKKEVLPESFDVFVQGSNFVDIDNDGFVDVFTCHDNGESRIWGNNGEGGFTPKDHWIDMSINGDSGESASGNYGSIWLDIDNDGDVDLYIAKCRQGVFEVDDNRRINQLYINYGNGNFSEEASSRGLAISWQSWTADFQDINNDGWLDCFITNHDHRSQMFINDGQGYFTELINPGINIEGLAIQGLMKDFDNDGWVDVVTTGSKGQVFKNNGDLTFTEIPDLFDENDMESLAIGDLNGDGYLDIYGGYAVIFNNPSSVNDKLWMNNGGENNYLAVSLIGKQSNRNAIGARVEIFGAWGIQIREVRAGESYGIANSNVSYFGLGNSESIDSIIIRWPSGLIQTEYDLKVNSKVKILEGQCLGRNPDITISGPTTFCSGDSVVLSAEEGFESYLWTNGMENLAISVSNSGNYSLEVVDSNGCHGFSENIIVNVDPSLYPIIIANGAIEICDGEVVELEVTNVDVDNGSISWSNDEVGYNLETEIPGFYSVSVAGLCSEFESNLIEVIVYEFPESPEASGDSILIGEVAVLNGVGENLAWYNSDISQNAIGLGTSVEIEGLMANSSFFAEDRSGSGFNGRVGMEEHEGSQYSQNPNQNNAIRFDAFKSFTLDSVKVYTDLPGPRRIVLIDQFNNEIASNLVDIESGESNIYLGLEVPEGENLRLTTDFLHNFENTGIFGPGLQRSDQNVDYPYIIEDIVSLKGSNFDIQNYYYFYYWPISSGVFCASERTEVKVVIEEPTSSINEELHEFLIYPNPSSGKFTIQFLNDLSNQAVCSIMDLSGEVQYRSEILYNKKVVLEIDLQPGLYFLQVVGRNRIMRSKIVVE